MGRLGWLLGLLVLAAWFPLAPYWLSDDFVAVAYAADLGRALSDFAGNQYGLEGVVWFYRPLVTVWFAVEQLLAGGPSPFVSHLSNAVAHAVEAVVVGAIAARFVGRGPGFLCGLVHGLAPAHTAALCWAVGRVDTFTGAFVGLACWGFVRFVDGRYGERAGDGGGDRDDAGLREFVERRYGHLLDGRRGETEAHGGANARVARSPTRLWATLALVAALCCKEHAIVTPALMALLGVCAAARGRRVRAAFAVWPIAAVVVVYLGLRFVLFGRIGGYDAATFDVGAAVEGLAALTARLVDPLLLLGIGTEGRDDLGLDVGGWPAAVAWLGFVPLVLAVVGLARRRRLGMVVPAVLAFAVLAAPTVPFWTMPPDLHALRYFHLPFAAFAFVLAAGGVLPAALWIAVAALPLVGARQDWHAVHADAAAMHAALKEDRVELPGEQVFVAGLPRRDAVRHVVIFHLGVDRLLRAPFVDGDERVVRALRPLDGRPDAVRVPYGDERGLPWDLPVLRFETVGIRARLPRAVVPDCAVELRGVERVATSELMALHEGTVVGRIVVRGVRAQAFRVTAFTAGGYVSAVVGDRGAAGAADGEVDLREWLVARYVTSEAPAHVISALSIPATFDLEPAFPVLVEALQGGAVTHANREPLVLRFDRGLAEFLRVP